MLSVLVVEDESIYRKYLRGILEEATLKPDIYEAADVAEAKELIDEIDPDLVLMDIRLPDGSGFEIARGLEKDHRHASVIFITGYDQAEFRREAHGMGAEGYFSKAKLKRRDLLNVVNNVFCSPCAETA